MDQPGEKYLGDMIINDSLIWSEKKVIKQNISHLAKDVRQV